MRLSPIDRERGATAILVALSLVLLLGFAALAVDGGAAFDDRRQQQSAADTGSLAAVQFANNRFAPMPVACTGSILQQSACRGADEHLAFRQFHVAPDLPLVLVTHVPGFE